MNNGLDGSLQPRVLRLPFDTVRGVQTSVLPFKSTILPFKLKVGQHSTHEQKFDTGEHMRSKIAAIQQCIGQHTAQIEQRADLALMQ